MRFISSTHSFVSTLFELVRGLHRSGYWWLIPLIIILLPLSLFFIFAQTVPIVAPFVYTLF